MVPCVLRLVLRRLAWVTAAGGGWCWIITAVLVARRSYAARNSWIRLLMPEGAGRSRSSRPGSARAAIRARSGLAPGSPAPGSCRGGRLGTLIGAAWPGSGGHEDVSARPAGPSARCRGERGRGEGRVWQRAGHMRAMTSKAGGSGREVDADAADRGHTGKVRGWVKTNERKPAKG